MDDHSRVAYAEIHDDETAAATAVAVLRRAVAWFAARGVTTQRVLSDNGSSSRSHAWRDTCLELGVTPKRTRPYRPQTNGKIERFHRTLADGWAFKRLYTSESARRDALPTWLHEYNHHRPHAEIGKTPPITRLTDLPGQYTEMDYTGPMSFESFSSAVVAPGLSNDLAIWRTPWTDGEDLARHARSSMAGQLSASRR